MLSFFSKKWGQIQVWLRATAIQSVQRSVQEEAAHRVLCVDDDPDFCSYLQHLAKALGIALDKAFSIQEAQQRVEKGTDYKAFIIDGHLPDGSGVELVTWLREKKNISSPIGFLSRIYHDAASFRILKEALKVDFVLDKPIDPQDVDKLLKQLCHLESPMPAHGPFPDTLLADIQEMYQKSIFDKIERLEKMILALQKDPTLENFHTLKTEVHKIAGSSGSYGYIQVSELCKWQEKELAQQMEHLKTSQFNPAWVSSLDEFFASVKLNFQMVFDDKKMADEGTGPTWPSIYVVSSTPLPLNLVQEMKKEGIDLIAESNPKVALEKLSHFEFIPHALLVQSHYVSSSLTGYELIRASYQKKEEELVSFIGIFEESTNGEEQAAAIKKGIPLVLTSPLSIPALMLLLDLPLLRLALEGYKVLVIDNDPDVCQYISQALKVMGADLMTLTDLSDIQKIVAQYQPDIILLDVNLSDERGGDGLNALKALRYENLLVAMVTPTQDVYAIEKVYTANVDDILFKPLERETLQKRISSLVKRIHRLTYQACRDITTGLFNAQVFYYYLQKRYFQDIPLQGMPTLVIFEVDGFDNLVDRMGKAGEKTLLSQLSQSIDELFKKYESCAYLGSGRIALIFNGLDLHFIRLFMQTFLIKLQSDLQEGLLLDVEVSLSCAILPLSKPLISIEQLDQYIEQTLVEAKRQDSSVKIAWRTGKLKISKQRRVLLIYEEIQQVSQLKSAFMKAGFKTLAMAQIEEEIEQHFNHLDQAMWPLTVLIGSLARTRGLSLLKKFSRPKNIYVPILYFSNLSSPDTLMALLKEEALNYVNCPFNLMILIEKIE